MNMMNWWFMDFMIMIYILKIPIFTVHKCNEILVHRIKYRGININIYPANQSRRGPYGADPGIRYGIQPGFDTGPRTGPVYILLNIITRLLRNICFVFMSTFGKFNSATMSHLKTKSRSYDGPYCRSASPRVIILNCARAQIRLFRVRRVSHFEFVWIFDYILHFMKRLVSKILYSTTWNYSIMFINNEIYCL
jgi:hypothetical protein